MGKLDRQLRKIPPKERQEIERVIEKIIARDLTGLNVKKLKGLQNVFRVRKGSVRIIFEFGKSEPDILSIERRSDHTYDM